MGVERASIFDSQTVGRFTPSESLSEASAELQLGTAPRFAQGATMRHSKQENHFETKVNC